MSTQTRVRRDLDVSSLLWGVVFACIAGIAGWTAFGNDVNWQVLRFIAPLLLIGLGILGLILSRPKH